MRKIILTVFILLYTTNLLSQEYYRSQAEEYKTLSSISPASSSFDFSDGSISWTLGETLVTLKVGNGNSSIPEIIELDYDIEAFPNPTNNIVTISHSSKNDKKLTCLIYDISGRVLVVRELYKKENEINMQYLPPAIYLVRITDFQNQSVKSFKIIKH